MQTREMSRWLADDQFERILRRQIATLPRDEVELTEAEIAYLHDASREMPRNKRPIGRYVHEFGPSYIRKGGCVQSARRVIQLVDVRFKAMGQNQIDLCVIAASLAEQRSQAPLDQLQVVLPKERSRPVLLDVVHFGLNQIEATQTLVDAAALELEGSHSNTMAAA